MPKIETSVVPDSALEAHLGILGMSGSGKSYAGRLLVERILSLGGRVCILDPTGVWWGLRLAPDGRTRSSFQVVVAGGRHGDVPLDADDGAALARIVGTSGTSFIIDTSKLNTARRTRFFASFAEELFVENAGALNLVLDESHLFAPQGRVPDPMSARMLHATNNLVALGRSRGFRIVLISQRPAKLHKDSLSQVSSMIAMRLVIPHDRKAVEGWIRSNAHRSIGLEVVDSLPGLATGEGWVWAPKDKVLERTRFPAISTFDSMRPEVQGSRDLPPIDIGTIRETLAAFRTTPSTTEGKPTEAALADAERRGYERGLAAGREEGRALGLREAVGRISGPAAALHEAITGLAGGEGTAAPATVAPGTQPGRRLGALKLPRNPKLLPPAAPELRDEPVREDPGSAPVAAAAERIMSAMAELAGIGVTRPTREMVAAMAGYRNTASKSVAKAFVDLKDAGSIDYPEPRRLSLTAVGRERVAVTEAGSPEEMRRRVCGVLGSPADRILGALVSAWPETMDRGSLGLAAGYTNVASKGFANSLSRLSDMGFVDYPAAGSVRAADILFPAAADA